MLRVPPQKLQDSVVQVAENSLLAGKPQGNHLVQGKPDDFETIPGFGSNVRDLDRVVPLLRVHQELAPCHRLELGELLPNVEKPFGAEPVPSVGIYELQARNPPGGAEIMVRKI